MDNVLTVASVENGRSVEVRALLVKRVVEDPHNLGNVSIYPGMRAQERRNEPVTRDSTIERKNDSLSAIEMTP